ncbi:MAG: hypothetical protein K2H47_00120 [Muribaculaceae bacterium]|nr:hypothetical protein [Muribaculaceae bacterium]
MIALFVEGTPIALPDDLSFDLVLENRLFSDADGFSLDFDVPIKSSPQNMSIFGAVLRPDVDLSRLFFYAELHVGTRVLKGCVAVLESSADSLSLQFLEGRSADNFYFGLDDIYINELELGVYAPSAEISCALAWRGFDEQRNADMPAVALPWVNNASGVINNRVVMSGENWVWHEETKQISWMPYLLPLTKRILSVVGYTFDLSEWENSVFRHLIITNAVPVSWGITSVAAALPHWSVKEFFSQLEYLLRGYFDFDHADKSVSFRFYDSVANALQTVVINDVIDDFSREYDPEEKSADFLPMRNLSFSHSSHLADFYDCQWYVDLRREAVISYDSLSQLIDANKWLGDKVGNVRGQSSKLMYARDVDCHFIFKFADNADGRWTHSLIPVNQFGPKVIDSDEDADFIDLKFIPAAIDMGDSLCVFNNPSSAAANDNSETAAEIGIGENREESIRKYQTSSFSTIEAGKKEKPQYYSNISVAFWPGYTPEAKIPYMPWTIPFCIADGWVRVDTPDKDFNLRINEAANIPYSNAPDIDPTRKLIISFLSDSLPDPRSVFAIRGKLYVCEKLSAEVTPLGFSRVMKGEFYPF